MNQVPKLTVTALAKKHSSGISHNSSMNNNRILKSVIAVEGLIYTWVSKVKNQRLRSQGNATSARVEEQYVTHWSYNIKYLTEGLGHEPVLGGTLMVLEPEACKLRWMYNECEWKRCL